MSGRDSLPEGQSRSAWAGIDLYLRALQRGRSPRYRSRSARPAHEREPPRLLLGTLPFLLLIASLALLAAALFLTARPGAGPAPAVKRDPPRELGTAPPGWFEEARRDFR